MGIEAGGLLPYIIIGLVIVVGLFLLRTALRGISLVIRLAALVVVVGALWWFFVRGG